MIATNGDKMSKIISRLVIFAVLVKIPLALASFPPPGTNEEGHASSSYLSPKNILMGASAVVAIGACIYALSGSKEEPCVPGAPSIFLPIGDHRRDDDKKWLQVTFNGMALTNKELETAEFRQITKHVLTGEKGYKATLSYRVYSSNNSSAMMSLMNFSKKIDPNHQILANQCPTGRGTDRHYAKTIFYYPNKGKAHGKWVCVVFYSEGNGMIRLKYTIKAPRDSERASDAALAFFVGEGWYEVVI